MMIQIILQDHKSMDIKNKSQLLKKLLYQSCNRGCKETDIIIGSYAKNNLNKLSDDELMEFEKILHLPDADIYDWYTKKVAVPDEYNTKIMQQLLAQNT